MDTLAHELADHLLGIEAELRKLGLWGEQRPDESSLGSLVPFCHDTLAFEQWLQWVFLPRMKAILEADEPLPSSSEIAPMAELRLAQLGQPGGPLLARLAAFDHFINRTL